MHQNPFSDPAEGAYDAPPDTVVGWGGGYPVSIPLPTRRLKLGASVLRPPQHKILATPVVHVSTGNQGRLSFLIRASIHVRQSVVKVVVQEGSVCVPDYRFQGHI